MTKISFQNLVMLSASAPKYGDKKEEKKETNLFDILKNGKGTT